MRPSGRRGLLSLAFASVLCAAALISASAPCAAHAEVGKADATAPCTVTKLSENMFYKKGSYKLTVKGIKPGGADATVTISVNNTSMSATSSTSLSDWVGSAGRPVLELTATGDTDYIQFYTGSGVAEGTKASKQLSKMGKYTWLATQGGEINDATNDTYYYFSSNMRVKMPIGVRSIGCTGFQNTDSNVESSYKEEVENRWLWTKRDGASLADGDDYQTVASHTTNDATLGGLEDKMWKNVTKLSDYGLGRSPNDAGGTWRALWVTGEASTAALRAEDVGFHTHENYYRITNASLIVNTAYITYKVRYDGNGNTGGSTADTDHVYNTAKNLGANGFTKTGYRFLGWATSAARAAAKTVDYTDQQSVVNLTATDGDAVDLYAVWAPNEYDVAYDGNGNTGGSTATSHHVYDVAKNLTANGFTKTGYTFAGWSTTKARADAGTTDRSDKEEVKNLTSTNGATVTLYASWTPVSYTVAYAGMDGAEFGASHPTSAKFDERFAVSAPKKPGYAFAGWLLTGMSGTTDHYIGDSATRDASAGPTKAASYLNLRASAGTVTFTATWDLCLADASAVLRKVDAETGGASPQGDAQGMSGASYRIRFYLGRTIASPAASPDADATWSLGTDGVLDMTAAPASGTWPYTGLPFGSYFATEAAAPAGYLLDSAVHPFWVVWDRETESVSVTSTRPASVGS